MDVTVVHEIEFLTANDCSDTRWHWRKGWCICCGSRHELLGIAETVYMCTVCVDVGHCDNEYLPLETWLTMLACRDPEHTR